MLDYHVHLWPHAPGLSLQASLDQLAAYCAHAASLGITELAITEHTSRFTQFDEQLRGWWDRDPSPARRAEASGVWDDEQGADLDQYVETALAAKAAGLPVVIGLEVDYFPGQMDTVATLLGGYPFDVLLGSVHWIGAWFFDVLEWAQAQQQWASRGVDRVWDDYTRALEELAGTGAVDVLAHPDLAKIAGHRPAVPGEFHDRIAEAARSCGLAAELNSSGWRRPCAEAYPAPALLARFHDLGVPITTASDGHRLGDVSWRISDLAAAASAAGYSEVTAFRGRRKLAKPL
ncbi:MAG TPA: histidinol-phosphatase [Streptosporangiaceae bacterium]|nr:histidinol-phosphatase [Streptosporangiaceae bacterium]